MNSPYVLDQRNLFLSHERVRDLKDQVGLVPKYMKSFHPHQKQGGVKKLHYFIAVLFKGEVF